MSGQPVIDKAHAAAEWAKAKVALDAADAVLSEARAAYEAATAEYSTAWGALSDTAGRPVVEAAPPAPPAPPELPRYAWEVDKCGCGHPVHEGHCPILACGCYAEPPKCGVCFHREHGGKDCFARGIRDANMCICKGPGVTSRRELEDHELLMARIR